MRNLLLAAILAAGACTSTGAHKKHTEVAETPSSVAPRFGRVIKLYEVVDQDTGELVGYVDLTSYDNGQEIYWVRNKERTDKRGYILTNNKGYRYVWHVGQRAEKPEFIGADTISANTRRILGYARPVELRETSLQALARKIQPKQEAPKAGDMPASEEAEDAGDDEE